MVAPGKDDLSLHTGDGFRTAAQQKDRILNKLMYSYLAAAREANEIDLLRQERASGMPAEKQNLTAEIAEATEEMIFE